MVIKSLSDQKAKSLNKIIRNIVFIQKSQNIMCTAYKVVLNSHLTS
ncbi:hypothetical protein CUMW_087620 [Citrus unshiu]|uniref:Uncharacterized protein n=1 Tax=Citrus unshiu TaxID=55188 RepID=A0A2H5NYI3_CITUN|nr:hypothetical protein CUMW_087620 [Citrus unshiu]